MPKTGADHSLEPPAPKLVKLRGKFPRVAVLSDIHAPFENKKAVKTAFDILSDYQPDLIVLAGDIFDNFQLSDHEKDADRRLTLQDELDYMGDAIIKPVDSLAPDVIYISGNHTARLQRLIRREPALFGLRSLAFKKTANLPDHWTFYQQDTHVRIGKLLYLHGDIKGRGGGAKNVAANLHSKLRTSCIFGHHHRFDTHYATDYEGHVSAAFANGHLCDVAQARYITAADWQSGFTLVEYSPNMKSYSVQQVLLVDGTAVWRGEFYG